MKDSQRFRNRLAAYILREDGFDVEKLVAFLELEIGAEQLHTSADEYTRMSKLIRGGGIRDVLDAITHIGNFLKFQAADGARKLVAVEAWRIFVGDLFQEEALGYSLDEDFGVRYIVDMEFEQVRLEAVSYLGSSRYTAVLQEFENAYRAIESTHPGTKLAVRSMFEAIETLFKLMVGRKASRLGSAEIRKFLSPMVASRYEGDSVAANTMAKLVSGLAEWADGLQAYRHGQAVEEPSSPPLETAVAALQTGSAYIRLLVELDQKHGS